MAIRFHHSAAPSFRPFLAGAVAARFLLARGLRAMNRHTCRWKRMSVKVARNANNFLSEPIEDTTFEQWRRWALAQADRIDPVVNGTFVQLSRDGLG